MGQEYNEKMFSVHTSSILHGELVGAGSLGPGLPLDIRYCPEVWVPIHCEKLLSSLWSIQHKWNLHLLYSFILFGGAHTTVVCSLVRQ
jgi:hypothetical protein